MLWLWQPFLSVFPWYYSVWLSGTALLLLWGCLQTVSFVCSKYSTLNLSLVISLCPAHFLPIASDFINLENSNITPLNLPDLLSKKLWSIVYKHQPWPLLCTCAKGMFQSISCCNFLLTFQGRGPQAPAWTMESNAGVYVTVSCHSFFRHL